MGLPQPKLPPQNIHILYSTNILYKLKNYETRGGWKEDF